MHYASMQSGRLSNVMTHGLDGSCYCKGFLSFTVKVLRTCNMYFTLLLLLVTGDFRVTCAEVYRLAAESSGTCMREVDVQFQKDCLHDDVWDATYSTFWRGVSACTAHPVCSGKILPAFKVLTNLLQGSCKDTRELPKLMVTLQNGHGMSCLY